ncbi:MAG: heme exporter protein CcmB [Calditrichia bacterium]
METNRLQLLRNAWIVFQKDVQLEFRSRYAVNAIFLFAVTTLVVVSFSIGGGRLAPGLSASLLWIILFFSAMSGLAHIFIREEEQQTADTLRMLTQSNAVFLGKWFFNMILLFGLEVFILPMFIIFMNVGQVQYLNLLSVIFLGSIGLSTVATLIAAIISRASSKGALFAVLSFPVSITILVSAIRGTQTAFQDSAFSDCFADLQILFSFSVVMFTVAVLLFEFIWRN